MTHVDHAWPVCLHPQAFQGPNNRELRTSDFYRFLLEAHEGWINCRELGLCSRQRTIWLYNDMDQLKRLVGTMPVKRASACWRAILYVLNHKLED